MRHLKASIKIPKGTLVVIIITLIKHEGRSGTSSKTADI